MKKKVPFQHVVITGGTGSLGQAIIKHLLKNDLAKRITSISLSESRIHQSYQDLTRSSIHRLTYHQTEVFHLRGDVKDKDFLTRVFQNADTIIHTAAMKHVPLCEQQPSECIKSNIMGTLNVLDAAIANASVKNIILLSTDKAPLAVNVYGISKFLLESLIGEYSKTSKARIIGFRSCNFFGSKGSVVDSFYQSMQKDKSVTLTNKLTRRCYISLSKVAEDICGVLQNKRVKSGDIVIPKRFGRINLQELVRALRTFLEIPAKALTVKFQGLRKGERLNDTLISDAEAPYVRCREKDYYILRKESKNDASYVKGISTADSTCFTQGEIIKMLMELYSQGGEV